MRAASMPLSVTRYSLVLTARCAASSSADISFLWCLPLGGATGAELPTSTRVASAFCWAFSATSSRQALDSLSTRVGRLVSRSNWIAQSVCVLGGGGGGGTWTFTDVVAEAVCDLSSCTLQVTVMDPAGAPVVARTALVPL